MFSRETFRFFKDLARNNRTEWMHQNRERYEAHIVAPFRRLLEALTPAVKELNPAFTTTGRTGQNFSRINRDIRFSRDKAPYRTQMYLMISEPAPKGYEAGQFYVGVTADVVTTGFRVYGDRKKGPLAKLVRPRVRANSTWVAGQAKKLGRKYESYWHSSDKGKWTKHEGWPKRLEEWERLEAWIVRRTMKPTDACKPSFLRDVVRIFRELMPLWNMTSAKEWKV